MADTYRKIHFPKCPYCGLEVIKGYNYERIVGLATGGGISDVVLVCDRCNLKFRVTCTTKFYAKKV